MDMSEKIKDGRESGLPAPGISACKGALLLAVAAMLPGCDAGTVHGRLQLAGATPDWSGYRVQLLDRGRAVGPQVRAEADGAFVLPSVAAGEPLMIEASDGRYRLRGLLTSDAVVVSARTTAVLALADGDDDGQLQADELAVWQQPDEDDLDAVYTIIHAVFYSAQQNGQKDQLLELYPDSWQLAQTVAHQPAYRRGFQLRYHDQLARSYALLQDDPAFAAGDGPLNTEQSLMLRLDKEGNPLRWQHLDFADGGWACVDYFEKGQRHPQIIGQWPLGVRLWAVSADLQVGLEQSRAADILSAYNTSSRCGYQGWRLPTQRELQTLTERNSGQWAFPRSLPFTADGNFWITGEQGETLVFDLQHNTVVDGAGKAQLLPFSFTADAPPPQKEQQTTPVDIRALRALYTQPPEQWPAPSVDDGVHWQELGSLPAVEFPADNPYSKEKVVLGQTLFFDSGLSAKGNTACASCHLPDQQWSDQRKVSVGSYGKKGTRNAMPIQNTAYNSSLFWDGRVSTLEEQSVHPVMDRLEMALTLDELLEKIKANPVYPPLFSAAFGDAEVTLERYKQAVAIFERTLISQPADFDRFLSGRQDALSDQQVWGLHLYRTKARCMNCHSGPALTDYTFRNTGLTYYGRKLEDRAAFSHTFDRQQMGAFRVPSLRDIAFSTPYMHNGVFPVLASERKDGSVAGVIPVYNAGMTKGRNANYPQYRHKYDPFFPVVDELIQPLGMSNEEMLALAAFLQSVSAPPRTAPAPEAVLRNPLLEIRTDQAPAE